MLMLLVKKASEEDFVETTRFDHLIYSNLWYLKD